MYSVGYMEGKEFDHTREHWREISPRPLTWASWYPSAIGGKLSSEHSKFPVVLLSHGTGGRAQSISWLGSRLAKQGFISIAVSHHGNSCIEPYMAKGFICWWERARDLSVILDTLVNQGPFANRFDLSAVSAVGFSLGGHTVLSLLGDQTNYDLFLNWLASKGMLDTGPKEFPDLARAFPELFATSDKFCKSMDRQGLSYKDDRIKSAVVLAPAPPIRAFNPSSLKSISIPVGIMVGQDDREAPHKDCAAWLKEQCPEMTLELLDKNVGHYIFLPEPTKIDLENEPDIYCDPVGVNRRNIHNQATQFVLETISSSQ